MIKLYSPMLAKPSNVEFLRQVESDPNWVAVEKFNGYRQLLYLNNKGNHLYSRYGNDHIANMPQFQITIPELDGTVLDCEGMSPTNRFEDNAACFKAHSESAIAWQKANGDAYLVAFDILAYRGNCTVELPLKDRFSLLRASMLMLRKLMPIRLEHLVYLHKERYYDVIVAQGGEGVIVKDLRALYTLGKRTNAWLKVKKLKQCKYFICGFLSGAGKYEGLVGSLLYTDSMSNLVIGSSSGMDDATRAEMTRFPDKYIGQMALFECHELTERGVMRHPRWKGLIKEVKVNEYIREC